MDIIIIVFCGPPAVGKTTLAKTLVERILSIQSPFMSGSKGFSHVCHIEYDSLIPVIQPLQWKNQRNSVARAVVDCCQFLKSDDFHCLSAHSLSHSPLGHKIVEKIVPVAHFEGSGDKPTILFILDDNFYYRSMRYDVYKLAADVEARFGVVCVTTASVETALERNKARSAPVAGSTVVQMFESFEMPKPEERSFEKNFLSVSSPFSDADVDRTLQFIETLIAQPPVRISRQETDLIEQERTRSREVTRKSVLHQADCKLRKIVGDKCNMINSCAKGPGNCAEQIAAVISCRKFLLRNIDKSELDYFGLHMDELENYLLREMIKACT